MERIRNSSRASLVTTVIAGALLGIGVGWGLAAHAGSEWGGTSDPAYNERQRQETQQRLDSWRREGEQTYRDQLQERARDERSSQANRFTPTPPATEFNLQQRDGRSQHCASYMGNTTCY
jgi:hypothetical protein